MASQSSMRLTDMLVQLNTGRARHAEREAERLRQERLIEEARLAQPFSVTSEAAFPEDGDERADSPSGYKARRALEAVAKAATPERQAADRDRRRAATLERRAETEEKRASGRGKKISKQLADALASAMGKQDKKKPKIVGNSITDRY